MYQICTKRVPKRLSSENRKALEPKDSNAFRGSRQWYPQRGGYGSAQYKDTSTDRKVRLFLFICYKSSNSNGSRFLPVDMRAVLLIVVIFMRLMAETACDQ